MLRDTKKVAMHPSDNTRFLAHGKAHDTGAPYWTENPFIATDVEGYTQVWLDKQAKRLGLEATPGFVIARARIETE
jgi:hypothetical protein